jgi:alcohol dehydrogenase (cytochrome c)
MKHGIHESIKRARRSCTPSLLIALVAITLPAQVPYERLRDATSEPESWLTHSGSYSSQRYSTLDQINRENVAELQPAWIYQIKASDPFEASPLIADGVMYLSEPPSDVTALDLMTGRPLWTYRRSLPEGIITCCGRVNRGVAVLDDQVIVGTVDAHLVALDAATGRVRWDVEVADYRSAYAITVAPLALKDKIIVGIAGGEFGIRGFLDAYDPATGDRLWRFWTVPGPGEPGNETWSGDSWKSGAAATWITGSYDPELNLVYWGTGNPGPDFLGDTRKGDNLYSDAVIALDADSGELRWHFQFTPHDVLDMDACQVPVLVDAPFQGEDRKLMLFPNRNGFYYVLDRVTGEYLIGREFAKQNWALNLDANGRPVKNLEAIPDEDGALAFPDDDGTANWMSPTYSPRTGLIYVPVREKGAYFYLTEAEYAPGQLFMGASKRLLDNQQSKGYIRALNALTGERSWDFELHSPPWAGLLSTAGDVLFSGSEEGEFFALDARTGKPLWRFQTGGRIIAAPVSYQSGDTQYVAIAAGGSLIAFALK